MEFVNSIQTLLTTPATTIVGKIAAIVTIVGLSWLINKMVNKSIQQLCASDQYSIIICKILNIILHITIVMTTVLFVLYHTGINLDFLYRIEHKIAALGFSGILLTLGLKDIIDDIFAGFMIVNDKNFKVGEYIQTKDWGGIIQSIDMRHTILKTDTRTIIVPNTVLYRSAITVLHDKEEQKQNNAKSNQ